MEALHALMLHLLLLSSSTTDIST